MQIKVILYDAKRRPMAVRTVEVDQDDWHDKYLGLISWCNKRKAALRSPDQRWSLDGRRFRTLGQCEGCGRLQSSLGWSIERFCSQECAEDAASSAEDKT
ncbi:MAG: hypothetical protein NXI32_06045 [bacterium]|nr:hypothetical protein [bacterium]